MKKNLIIFVFIFLITIISFEVVHAYSSSLSKDFGGQITDTKAKDIDKWEKQGYTCTVIGSTMEIKPQNMKMPSSYMIPIDVKSKTNNTISRNQNIIGKYNGKKKISCKKECPPPPGRKCTQIVILDKVDMYGNSKFGGFGGGGFGGGGAGMSF